MALVSPGVQVTVTDESFFVPASAPTVPLIFIATAAEKTQPDGVTPAAGTFEHDVVRTVTSLNQSVELYGQPVFQADDSGAQLHGDARNEYGLFALNQFLGVGNLAYVVRANVNLDDNLDSLREIWDGKMTDAATVLDNLISAYITEYNQTNGYVPSNPLFKVTVSQAEFISLARQATDLVWDFYSFRNSEDNFFDDNSLPVAATSGYQIAGFAGRIDQAQQLIDFSGTINSASRVIDIGNVAATGSEATGLSGGSPEHNYHLRVTVDGTLVNVVVQAGSVSTWEDLVDAMNVDLLENGAFAQLVDGNIRIVSGSTGSTSSIGIQDGVASASPFLTPLLASLDDFVAINSQSKGGANPTTLPNDSTLFTLSVQLNGGATQNLQVQGQNAQTFDELVVQLNAQLVGGTIALTDDGNMLVWSNLSDADLSAVDVTSGDLADLYAGFVGSPVTAPALAQAVVGAMTLGAGAGSPTLANPHGLEDGTYTMSVAVDGIPRAVQVNVGGSPEVNTFAHLIDAINVDLAPVAVASVVDGNIVITSASTGPNSTVVVTDQSLLSSLPWFVGLQAPVAGLPGDAALDVYRNGYDLPSTGGYDGLEGIAAAWVDNSLGSTVPGEWTAEEAAATLLAAADDYKFTVEFLNETSLGANDAARRVAITTALQAAINSNTEVRSEAFEFNLIVAPGYPEVVDELIALSVDLDEEAFVIADTPMNMSPSEVVAWGATSARFSSSNVAYYYPHGLASNLDGVNVMCAASGIALRTYAVSDNTSELWFAPAGTRRGLVTGVSTVGYVSDGEFVEVNLNKGQRDDLYKYFTNINPITFYPGRGLLIFGQKTSASAASALDRVNVARLIGFVRRQLRKSLLAFAFEPNDALTRDSVKAAADNFLGDLIVRRGLYDYVTICDGSNNTPDRIDRNELYVDVALQPVKAAEFIYVPIRIVATSTEL